MLLAKINEKYMKEWLSDANLTFETINLHPDLTEFNTIK